MFDLTVDFFKLKFVLIFLCVAGIILASIPTVSGIISTVQNAQISNKVRLPVIMYHHILDKKSKLNKYTISPKEFESDLKYIAANGYTTVTVKQLIDFCDKKESLPKKPIMITFDDGYESVYCFAYPLLKKYKMQAVINIIGKYADLYSECDDRNINYSHITWEQLNTISTDGTFEVQNHTYDMHTNNKRNGIARMSGESNSHYTSVITTDLEKMQQRVKEKMNYTPTAFAYPFGSISKDALPIIKKVGLRAVFCCWEKVNYLSGDSEELYHINRFNRPHNRTTAEFFEKIEKN